METGDVLSRQCTSGIVRVSKTDRTIRYRLSDDSIDREHSRVVSSGIGTEEYEKNPIFLWAHDSRGGLFGGTPDMENVIGRTVGWKVTQLARDNQLDGLAKRHGLKMDPTEAFDIDVEHAPESVNPRGERAFRMVKAGFLNMTSIGAGVRKVDKQRSGVKGIPDIVVYSQTTLFEGSLVPIPANPNAVALARAVVADYDVLDTFDGHDAEDVQKWVAECRGAPRHRVDHALGSQIAKAISDNLVTGERSPVDASVITAAASEALDRAGFK